MSAQAVKGKNYRPIRQRERLVDFRAERVAAPFALRCASMLADYLLVIICPVLFFVIGRAMGNDGAGLINSGLNDAGWLVGILIGFVSFLLLPAVTGRTFGKLATGIRIVGKDGAEASAMRMIARQCVGGILFILTAGLSFFFSALHPNGRSLHDLIAGTIVIYADKRPR